MTTVNLNNVIQAAHLDPPGPQGFASHKADVLPVEQALAQLHFLDPKYVDGSYGSLTIAAYKRYQESLHYSGNDADGIPGQVSLTRLGSQTGLFTVTGVPNLREVAIPLSAVQFHRVADYSCTAVIKQVCADRGVPTTWWLPGGLTVAARESSYRVNAVNNYDLNAHGPIQSDGYPLYCSRGAWQFIAPTFAAHHHPGTSNNIYDGVALFNAFINYTMDNYGVAADGHNLAARVQQADPNRPPRGY